MAQQALHGGQAQARLDHLQQQYDEAFGAYAANPSNILQKERYHELKSLLHEAANVVSSLAKAHSTANAGWQTSGHSYSLHAPLLFLRNSAHRRMDMAHVWYQGQSPHVCCCAHSCFTTAGV